MTDGTTNNTGGPGAIPPAGEPESNGSGSITMLLILYE
jgi:hypothetical protein